ncbi:MAG TPA: ferritin family protein [Anaeromyxobacteraceae bacterium]|nr:ferritin family protein [Anaeromyxobacteraceae bacterium]
MGSTYSLLERAERLERLASEIYLALASRYGGEIKALFERLAIEEAQHANRVRLLASRYRHDSRLVASVPGCTAELDALAAEAELVLRSVVEGAWDGDADAALRRAAELEARFSQAHASSLSRDAHPELLAFFEQLAAQDEAHRRLLERTEPAPRRQGG